MVMNIYSAISANKWKTWLIMSLFIVFITTLAYIFGKALGGGISFVGIALIFQIALDGQVIAYRV